MAYKQKYNSVAQMSSKKAGLAHSGSAAMMTGPGDGDKKKETEKKETEKRHHPGYRVLPKYDTMPGDSGEAQIFNALQKSAYKQDSISHRQKDLAINFPALGGKLNKKKVLGIDQKTGDYLVEEGDQLEPRKVTRRQAATYLETGYADLPFGRKINNWGSDKKTGNYYEKPPQPSLKSIKKR